MTAALLLSLSLCGQLTAAELDAILDKCEAQRPRVIELAKGDVEQAKAELARARSNRGKDRAYAVRVAENRIKSAKARVAALERGDDVAFIGYEYFSQLDVGTVASVEGVGRIIQVIDDQNCLIQWDGSPAGALWLAGVATAGCVDGGTISLPAVFYVPSAKSYDTALGGQKTVLVMQPLDVAAIRDAWKKRQAALKTKSTK